MSGDDAVPQLVAQFVTAGVFRSSRARRHLRSTSRSWAEVQVVERVLAQQLEAVPKGAF